MNRFTNRRFAVKLALCFALLAMTAVVVGCQDKKATAANPSVTELTPTPAQSQTPQPVVAPDRSMQYASTGDVGPMTTNTPEINPAVSPSSPSAGSTKYTVKHGDTLWKIATTRYGDGKQYKKILDANPGLTASTLKAGQTITLP
jgi:nucleoid-associated protein YgaU